MARGQSKSLNVNEYSHNLLPHRLGVPAHEFFRNVIGLDIGLRRSTVLCGSLTTLPKRQPNFLQ